MFESGGRVTWIVSILGPPLIKTTFPRSIVRSPIETWWGPGKLSNDGLLVLYFIKWMLGLNSALVLAPLNCIQKNIELWAILNFKKLQKMPLFWTSIQPTISLCKVWSSVLVQKGIHLKDRKNKSRLSFILISFNFYTIFSEAMVGINLAPTAKIIANFDKRTREKGGIMRGHQTFAGNFLIEFYC